MGRSSIDLYSNDIGAPFAEIQSFAAYVGGSPTNIAVGCRRLGLEVALLTAMGADKVGDFIVHFLEQEGVATEFIPTKAFSSMRSSALLRIEENAFPLVFYRDNAADIQLTIDDVLASPIDRCQSFEFSGTGLSKEPSRSATLFAAERASQHGATVFLDLDFRADQWHDPRAFGVTVRAALKHVTVAIGTEEEINAAMLRDPADLVIRDQQISAPEIRGDLDANIGTMLDIAALEALVVKRGPQGATVHLTSGEVVEVPDFPVEVMNILGAGDAFAAGFIYGRLKGWDWYRSARMGNNACGAIVVTRHGCANFMGYEDEVLAFAESQGGL